MWSISTSHHSAYFVRMPDIFAVFASMQILRFLSPESTPAKRSLDRGLARVFACE
jgi:hypothetical protein